MSKGTPDYLDRMDTEPEPKTPEEAWATAQQYEGLFWRWYIQERRGYTERAQFLREKASMYPRVLAQFRSLDPGVVQGRVLEVGCGVVSVLESQPGLAVLATDPNLLQYSETIPEFTILGQVDNCFYCCCFVQDVKEDEFDVVWSYNVLSHTVDWPDMIFHMHRHLKPGGLLLLGANVANELQSRRRRVCHPTFIKAEDLLAHVAECGFNIGWHTPITDKPSRYMMIVWATRGG